MIVLMPDHDGEVGTILVEGSDGTVTASGSHDTVMLRSGKPEARGSMEDMEVRAVFADAMRVEPTPPRVFLLHHALEAVAPSEAYLPVIEEIIAEIDDRKSLDISINGHTDSSGDPEFNMQLSERRANYIKELLVSRGVRAASIATDFHGEGDPLFPIGSDAPVEMNRRVEVIVR